MKSYLMKYFWMVLVIGILFLPKAYSNKQDSLKYLVKGSEDAHSKVQLLNDLSLTYLDSNFLEAIKIASEALDLAKMLQYKDGIIDSYIIIGYSYFYNRNYSRALENYLLASRYLKSTLNYSTLVQTYTDIASIYNTLENPKKAIYYNAQSLKILNKNVDSYLIKNCYFSLARSYRLLKDYNNELNYLKKGIEIIKKNKLDDQLGVGYNKLGYAYWDLKDYNAALKYYAQYLQLSKELKDSVGLATAYSNIGSTLYSKGEYQESIKYFESALNLHQLQIMAYTQLELSKSYCKLNDLNMATHYFALAQSENADLKDLSGACKLIVEGYQKANNSDKALYYFGVMDSIKDSLYNLSKADMEITAKTRFDVEGVEARIYERANQELLKSNLELQNSYNRIFVVVIILLLIIVAGVGYIYRRSKLIHEEKLSEIKEATLAMGELLFPKSTEAF